MRRGARAEGRPLASLTRLATVAVAAAVCAGGAPAGLGPRCEYDDVDPARAEYALDIESVEVTRRASSLLFRITFADELVLADDDGIQVAVDTDRGTGDEDGDDYFFDFIRGDPFGPPTLNVWEEDDWTEVEGSSLRFALQGNDAVFRIAARELGNADRFGFWVVAEEDWDPESEEGDYAPEYRDQWQFPSCRAIDAPGRKARAERDASFPLAGGVLGAMLALGAALGVAGWARERIRARRAG